MKERPILFSGPMVRAILEGRKTQTRRIVNPQPDDPPAGWYPDAYNKTLDWCFWGPRKTPDAGRCTLPLFRNKYGQTGDRLWVRETWQKDPLGEFGFCFRASGHSLHCKLHSHLWRPSIFMPRYASRITLEIESVRVEMLQEITEEDAKAEGVVDSMPCGYLDNGTSSCSPRCKFKALWQSINGPGSWDQNPRVWVIQFKRLEAK